MKLREDTKAGAIGSLIIHFSVVVLMVAVFFLRPLNSEPVLVVMELVPFADDTPVTLDESSAPPEPVEPEQPTEPSPPDPEPPVEIPLPEVPVLNPIPLPPEPPPPAPPPPPVRQVERPTPPPPPPPPPQTMTREEFERQFGRPRPQPPRPAPVREVRAPTVSDSNIGVTAPSAPVTPSNPSATPGALQENYLNRIRRILDNAWERPNHLPTGTVAVIEFRVNPDGRIELLRVISSSGISEFEQTIRQAFARAARVPTPPNARALTDRVTFRLD